jgi:phospho-N-acetylmuramoyl-pentapeptide-transferase
VAGKLLIPALVRLKAGQSIKEIGPTWHMTKQGTPTMGGLMFIIGIGVAILIAGWPNMMQGDFTHLYVYAFAMVFGVIGYIDDYQKVKHKQNTGLTSIQKFLLQLAAAIAFLCLMRLEGLLSTKLYVPFFNTQIVLNWVVYLVFAAFVIVGAVNAVNLTDGLDGLAIMPVVLCVMVYAVYIYVAGHASFAQYLQVQAVPGVGEVTVFCCALMGAGLGFLWFNCYPAQVFMGDVGALSLGGVLGFLAVLCKQELMLIVAGGVFVLETVSVIMQVGFFKATHGKRLFRMTPLHHHFQKGSRPLPESKIIVRFWIVSVLLAIASLSVLKLR